MTHGRGIIAPRALLLVASIFSLGIAASAPPPVASRFFFSGNGQLTLEDARTQATVAVHFRRPDGSYDASALQQLRQLLRSRGDNHEGELSLRLVEQLDYLEDWVHPRHLRVVSGYRSSEYNAAIRDRGAKASRASLHTQGLAVDVQFDGVDARWLWLRIRELNCCGTGYYEQGGPFLHIDVGPPRFWEAATSKVDQNLSGGNARIFARTDFDRYEGFDGARVRLHSITAFPLRVSSIARLWSAGHSTTVRLTPDGNVSADGDCLVVTGGEEHCLRVVSSDSPAPGSRARLQLRTCLPRVERTPEHFESNEIEIVATAQSVR